MYIFFKEYTLVYAQTRLLMRTEHIIDARSNRIQ